MRTMDSLFSHQVTTWLWKLLILLAVSVTSGLILSAAYQVGSRKSEQVSQPFAWLFPIMPALISVLIFMVEDNFLRAVYLLGATTLVRFRNPVKNPFITILVYATVAAGAAAGFGYYLGSLILALFCLAIVWVGCSFTHQPGVDVIRVLYLDCPADRYPDRILYHMGKWLKGWTKLSAETSVVNDHLQWCYQVRIRREQEINALIEAFEHLGIRASVLVPDDLQEF
jgi:hypothetical protein